MAWGEQWPGAGVESGNAQVAGRSASPPTRQTSPLTGLGHAFKALPVREGFASKHAGPLYVLLAVRTVSCADRAGSSLVCGVREWESRHVPAGNHMMRTGMKAGVNGLERRNRWQGFILRNCVFNCKIPGGAC